ncbi:MAG: glycosyltransferase family 2 protein [Acidobacteriota bacterium]|nr:glycosyltransferase family 2 protein [Acidobacteriota bacterium]
MKPNEVVPLLLTFDEAPNLPRTLGALGWAESIVVVDSGSTDGTREILAADPRVELLERRFDNHAAQWRFGFEQLRGTPWVLALDADFVVPGGFAAELEALGDAADFDGFEAAFTYVSLGKPLRGSILPPRLVLVRPQLVTVEQDGHAHRPRVPGKVGRLRERFHHDDRKPFAVWLAAQERYARLEAGKLLAARPAELPLTARLRRCGWITPWLVPLYVLFARGGILDGRAGWYYALQRGIAEALIALRLLEARTGWVSPGGSESR